MRLSMWVLADWLASEGIRAEISEGPRELRNVRLLPSSGSLSRSTVYLDSDESGNVLCTCGRDLIVVPDSDIDAVLGRILDCFEHYNDFDTHLRDLVAENTDISSFLDDAGCALGQFFVVADATYYLHAWGGDRAQIGDDADLLGALENQTMPLSAIMHVNKQRGTRTRGRESYLMDVRPMQKFAAVTNLFYGDRHEGWLVSIAHDSHFTRGSLHLQDALAPMVSQCLHANASAELRMDRAAAFVDLLDFGPAERERADGRLATLGWEHADRKRIYAIRQIDDDKDSGNVTERFLEHIDPTLVVAGHGGDVLVFADSALVDETRLEEAMRPILVTCGCCAGKSPEFTDTGAAAEQARAARVAVRHADSAHLIVGFDEIKLSYALETLREATTADVGHKAVARLLAYDNEHDSQLIGTLRAYLDCACSATAAAKRLFIHRTTMLYRLERIAEIGGLDLADPDARFHLDLTLRLMDTESDRTG